MQKVWSPMNSMARRMFELVEPIGVIPYAADEPNESMFALGFTNYRDTYFAGRAAPLGLPRRRWWTRSSTTSHRARWLATSRRCGARRRPKRRSRLAKWAVSRRYGGSSADHVDSPDFARAAELLPNIRTASKIANDKIVLNWR